MPQPFTYCSSVTPAQQTQLNAILSQCFISPIDSSDTYTQRIGPENFRLLQASDDAIVGGLALIPMGQWWGGRPVPMTGVASVGIAPEYRGAGAAIALMRHMLHELHATSTPISVLYPAVQQLYRKAGYEQGGCYCQWEIAPDQIRVTQPALPAQPISPLQAESLRLLDDQQALGLNGCLRRHGAIWQGILQPSGDVSPRYGYWLGSADRPEGYVIISQHHGPSGPTLQLHDWVVLTAAAGQTLWAFLASHRSQIKTVQWHSGAVDGLSLLLPEQTARLRHSDRWMLRLVHLASALEHRGYPAHIETDLHLAVEDDLLPANSGNYILSVAQGRGQVTSGGRGDLKLHIRQLAALYTGLFSARQLQLTGQLEATEAAIATATTLFSGPSPWMRDFF